MYKDRLADAIARTTCLLDEPLQNWQPHTPSMGVFFQFYTHQEYREKVGERRYRLLTVQ